MAKTKNNKAFNWQNHFCKLLLYFSRIQLVNIKMKIMEHYYFQMVNLYNQPTNQPTNNHSFARLGHPDKERIFNWLLIYLVFIQKMSFGYLVSFDVRPAASHIPFFQQRSYSIIHNVSSPVCKSPSRGNVIFSVSIKDRQLKVLLKILITYAHLIYTLCCLSLIWGARSISRF